jgi:hypothetical protein
VAPTQYISQKLYLLGVGVVAEGVAVVAGGRTKAVITKLIVSPPALDAPGAESPARVTLLMRTARGWWLCRRDKKATSCLVEPLTDAVMATE